MISLVQMRQLMHHNIFQTLLRPAGQQRIQIDAACAHVAGTPARFHTMHLKPCMTHAHFLFPCLQQLLSSAGYLLLIEVFYKGAPGFLAQLAAIIKADSVSLHLIGTMLFAAKQKVRRQTPAPQPHMLPVKWKLAHAVLRLLLLLRLFLQYLLQLLAQPLLPAL